MSQQYAVWVEAHSPVPAGLTWQGEVCLLWIISQFVQHRPLTQLTEAHLDPCNPIERVKGFPGQQQSYSCGVINISMIQDVMLPQDVTYSIERMYNREKKWFKDRLLAEAQQSPPALGQRGIAW